MDSNNILLTFLLLTSYSAQLSKALCNLDSDCQNEATCSPGGKDCPDFHVANLEGCCVKMASYGRRCEEDIQCQAVLGPHSECNHTLVPSMGVCNCYNKDEPALYYNGRCNIPREIGENCENDNDCILGSNNGSNIFAKCEDTLCICSQNSVVSLETRLNSEGVCVMECKDCTSIEISLTAIILSVSFLMVVFLFGMCKIMSKQQHE